MAAMWTREQFTLPAITGHRANFHKADSRYLAQPLKDGIGSMNAVLISDVWPQQAVEFRAQLEHIGRVEISAQISMLAVPPQRLSGAPSSFSFMAYPVPRLTYEERYATALRGTESLELKIDDGAVNIDLDDFGQINWLRVEGLPFMYVALFEALNR